MHERETIMQSGENLAVLVVCVWSTCFVNTHCNLRTKHTIFPSIFHGAASSSLYMVTVRANVLHQSQEFYSTLQEKHSFMALKSTGVLLWELQVKARLSEPAGRCFSSGETIRFFYRVFFFHLLVQIMLWPRVLWNAMDHQLHFISGKPNGKKHHRLSGKSI